MAQIFIRAAASHEATLQGVYCTTASVVVLLRRGAFLMGSTHIHISSASTPASCFVLSLCTLMYSLMVLFSVVSILWDKLSKTTRVVRNCLWMSQAN